MVMMLFDKDFFPVMNKILQLNQEHPNRFILNILITLMKL